MKTRKSCYGSQEENTLKRPRKTRPRKIDNCSSADSAISPKNKRVTASTEKAAIRMMGMSESEKCYRKYLQFLVEVCRSGETPIKVCNGEETYIDWKRFAEKFTKHLEETWNPEMCESYSRNLGHMYLTQAQPNYDRLSEKCKSLLDEIFVENRNLFPALADTDTQKVKETPPHKLAKRSESSSVRNISKSDGSNLSEGMENEVRQSICFMAQNNMLSMMEIIFAQEHLTKSSWAALAFLEKEDMKSKRDFIVEAMGKPEGSKKNKKKKSWM